MHERIYSEVMAKAGSLRAISEALDISVPSVTMWRKRGIPLKHIKAIEAFTGISVRRLRPTDWRDYWPDAPPASRIKPVRAQRQG